MADKQLSVQDLIQDLQARIESVADPKTKSWWEKYMRYAATFRGVNLVAVREQVRNWHGSHALDELPVEAQLDLALSLFESLYTEDKLAGVLYIEEFLL